MSVTEMLVAKTQRLKIAPEITPGDHGFSMFNSGSTEVEVSEFLYSLVRLIKPEFILETGTHFGVSSAYMGQALSENNKGHLVTLEINPVFFSEATKLHDELGLAKRVTCLIFDSLKYEVEIGEHIGLLFLDSEPHLRFDEFVRFWPRVQPGGFILIHDLHPHLGHTDIVTRTDSGEEIYDFPYGDFRPKIGDYIKRHQVQTISFPTPRGFTLFQKSASNFAATQLLYGQL